MGDAERLVILALWAVPGLGPKSLEQVRAAFPSLGELFERPVKSWLGGSGLVGRVRAAVARLGSLAQAAERVQRAVRQHDYRVVFPGDAGWPPGLMTVPWAPPLLFARGPGAEGRPCRRLAVVGTRAPETGACAEVRRLVAEVAGAGVGIVSGAAEGIDRAAHLGALDAGGETWAFLACAIEEMDPPQRALRRVFEAGRGTFFTQFPPGVRSNKARFVQRNAWVSGAADAVLVARAPWRSGALITAARAREQGRPLLVLPGDPWNGAAAGSNALLREGARVCLGPRDALEAVGLPGTSATGARAASIDTDAEALGPTAARVLEAVQRAPSSFEALQERLGGLSGAELASALLELELAGHVLQRPGKHYERVA